MLTDERGRAILELWEFPEELVVRVHHSRPTEHDRYGTIPEDRIYTPMLPQPADQAEKRKHHS